MKGREVLVGVVAIPVSAAILRWLLDPSLLGTADSYLMWCVVAAVATVNLLQARSMPRRSKPLVNNGGTSPTPKGAQAPEEKRFRMVLYVSVPLLGTALNRVYAPATFGQVGALFVWLVLAAVLLATGVMLLAVLD